MFSSPRVPHASRCPPRVEVDRFAGRFSHNACDASAVEPMSLATCANGAIPTSSK